MSKRSLHFATPDSEHETQDSSHHPRNLRLKILLLEDNPADAELIETELRKGGILLVLKRVETGDAFAEELKTLDPDVILSDFSLPRFDAFGALEIYKSSRSNAAFILVTGSQSEEVAVECIKRGADDYILKTTLKRLPSAVLGAVEKKRNEIEREKAIAALRDAEAKYRDVFENMITGIYQTTLDGRFITANPALARILGYETPEEMMSTVSAFGERFYVDKERRAEFVRLILEHGFISEFESQVYKKDWSVIWISESARTVQDSSGRVIGFEGTTIDITKRKLAEDEQARLVDMLEATTDFVATADRDGRAVYINRAGRRMLGISENTDVSTLTISMGHPDWARKLVLNEAIPTAIREGVWRGETAILTGDGRDIPVLQVIIAHKEQNGEVQFLSTIARDISELKLREEKIREQAALLDKTQDAIMVRDLDDRILFWNKGAEKMYGWSAEEAIGRKVTEILFKEIPPEFEEGKRKVIEEDEWIGELKQTTKTGDEIIVDARLTLVRDGKDQPQSILAIKTDITERKSIEKQLLRSQRLESIGTLAGGIAHDFNNILSIIMGYTTFIAKRNLDEEKFDMSVGAIQSAAERGAGLVRQLLTFARKEETNFQPMNLNDMINEVSKLIVETFPKVISVNLDLAEDLPLVLADQGQMHQSILNLCVNARDAMLNRADGKSPGGILKIQTAIAEDKSVRARFHSAAPARYAAIIVSDTGIGMDEATRARIFEPFFTTKERGRGTGLGLATVYGIMEKHGGFIDVSSESGVGTKFTIYLPSQSATKREAAAKDGESIEIGGGSETIMVVEDEAALREIFRDTLAGKGYKVLTAGDGEKAISLLKSGIDVKLVLCDMGLPKLSGLEVAEKMKQTYSDLRVIIASGFVEPGEREKMKEQGIDDFIQKPCKPHDLLKMVREVLDK